MNSNDEVNPGNRSGVHESLHGARLDRELHDETEHAASGARCSLDLPMSSPYAITSGMQRRAISLPTSPRWFERLPSLGRIEPKRINNEHLGAAQVDGHVGLLLPAKGLDTCRRKLKIRRLTLSRRVA